MIESIFKKYTEGKKKRHAPDNYVGTYGGKMYHFLSYGVLARLHYPSHSPATVGKYGIVGTRQG
jgi:hypothetical protein